MPTQQNNLEDDFEVSDDRDASGAAADAKDLNIRNIEKEIVSELCKETDKNRNKKKKKKKKNKKNKEKKSKLRKKQKRAVTTSEEGEECESSDSFDEDFDGAVLDTNLDTVADRQLKELSQMQNELKKIWKGTDDDDDDDEEDNDQNRLPASNQEAEFNNNDKNAEKESDVENDGAEDNNDDHFRHSQIRDCLNRIREKENELSGLPEVFKYFIFPVLF